MLSADRGNNRRIVGRDRRTCAQGGLHESGSASSCATCSSGGAARTRAGSASAKSANASARSSLNHTSVDPTKESTSLGTKYICVRDGQVVASDGQIEIVFKREINGILQRKVKLAITHQLLKTGRIRQRRLRDRIGSVCLQRI